MATPHGIFRRLTIEAYVSIVGIVLAAGSSTRLGQPKQLVQLDGELLLTRTIRVMEAAHVARVAVVIGAQREAVESSLGAAGQTATRLINPRWHEGMSSSIRVGIEWASTVNASGALLCVCDQPLLTTDHINALIAAHARTSEIVGSRYGGVVGVPAIFPATAFVALCSLSGDRGARQLLTSSASIDWDDGALDIDTPEQLAVFLDRLAQNSK
ncbi:MAG TPA: nucleotidyltransferase family protein [Kofleriaceae bacterium]